jgi:hypothetical protein
VPRDEDVPQSASNLLMGANSRRDSVSFAPGAE